MNDLTPPASLAWTDDVLTLHKVLAQVSEPLFIVGGAVRDAFTRAPIRDIDLATPASGLKIARWLANQLGGAFYALDDVREVGRVIYAGRDGRLTIDVARFRGDSLEADLRDRDFTINAMAVDVHSDLSALIDPCGGLLDLKAKRLRQCDSRSLENDAIRCIRAVRYCAQFGLQMEPATRAAVRKAAPLLENSARERVRDELFKLLDLARPRIAIMVADALGILTYILPDAASQPQADRAATQRVIEHLTGFTLAASPARTDETAAQFALGMFVMALDRFRTQINAHMSERWPDGRSTRALLMLAALLRHLSEELVEEYASDLRLSNPEKHRWTTINRWLPLVASTDVEDPVAIYRFWRGAGDAGVDVLLLSLADFLGTQDFDLDQDRWLSQLEKVRMLLFAWLEAREQFVDPPALTDGDDVMQALGLPPGKLIGAILEAIREAQVSGSVLTREDALALARRLATDDAGA